LAPLSDTFSNNSKKTRFFGMKIWRNELSPAITDVLTGYEIKASPPGDPVYVRINNSLIHFELA
jgi:hypothetical protein